MRKKSVESKYCLNQLRLGKLKRSPKEADDRPSARYVLQADSDYWFQPSVKSLQEKAALEPLRKYTYKVQQSRDHQQVSARRGGSKMHPHLTFNYK